MNTIRKVSCVLMLVAVIAAPLFATEPTDPVGPGVGSSSVAYDSLGVVFSPISVRSMGMGGAGIAVAGTSDSFFLNPAALANRKFQLSLPSIGVTVYNPQQILEQGIIEDIKADKEEDAAQKFLGILSRKGFNEALTSDVAFSLSAGGFGLGIQAQEKIHSYSPDGKTTSTKLIAEANAVATLGYGLRIHIIEDSLSIDLGVAARFNYRAYNQAVTADDFIGLVAGTEDTDDLLNETPLMAGWAVPIDAGVNVNLPLGFTISTVVRNLNGKYHMTAYPGISNWAKEVLGVKLTSDGSQGAGTNSEFEFTIPWSLDAGFGWAPSFGSFDKILRPTVAVDVVDLVDLFGEEVTTERLLTHLKAGAEVKLFSMLDVRAGLNQGYITIGAGVDLFVIRLEAAYYRQEFGVQLDDKPVDALTIRANIGFDR